MQPLYCGLGFRVQGLGFRVSEYTYVGLLQLGGGRLPDTRCDGEELSVPLACIQRFRSGLGS